MKHLTLYTLSGHVKTGNLNLTCRRSLGFWIERSNRINEFEAFRQVLEARSFLKKTKSDTECQHIETSHAPWICFLVGWKNIAQYGDFFMERER